MNFENLDELPSSKKALIAFSGFIVGGWMIALIVYGFGGAIQNYIMPDSLGWIGGGTLVIAIIIGYCWLVFVKLYPDNL